MSAALSTGDIPVWAETVGGTVDLFISFSPSFDANEIITFLRQQQVNVIETKYSAYHVLGIRVNKSRLNEVASLPFIEYLEPVPHPDQPLNYSSQAYSAASALKASGSVGGKELDGQGVMIGVGDNGNISTHIDFNGRLINRSASAAANHALHVSGTVAGGGIKEEKNEGYAPGATIISQNFSNIIVYAPTYVNDYNMVVANNSYGAVAGDCNYAGTYDLVSRILDQQSEQYPHLQHVFAAGNDGGLICERTPGYRTVLGSMQSAKNIISVGGVDYGGSSIGPVKDGRLKPEIVASASNTSTYNNHGYGGSSGTSMAAPAVSGGLALLIQQYRQQFANADPKSGLMKALLCNGATDWGTTGPDFRNGYGSMNLARASDMLANGRFFSATLSQGMEMEHTISGVPAGSRLKVMLYWNDPAASPLVAKSLVNELDLEVLTPSAGIVYPYTLDTTAANLSAAATNGVDRMNNMEQVVVNVTEAGNYTFRVKGFAINENPVQEYFVVYDVIPAGPVIRFPIGGEVMVPETVQITWEEEGEATATYTVSISTDNGANWTDYVTSTGVRKYALSIPAAVTEQALVRITNNVSGLQTVSQPFVILGRPTVSLATDQCEGYINLNWTSVPGATQYEVMQLKGRDMETIHTTADASATNYAIGGLSEDSTYWVTVRAVINGKSGRRGVAVFRTPASGTCNGTISDFDLKIDSVLAPVSGREFCYSALSATENVVIRIKNLDNEIANDFTVRYRINGGSWISQQINTGLARGAYEDVVFKGADFSATGTYLLEAEVINHAATDPVVENNIKSVTIQHVPNTAVDLTNALIEDAENAIIKEYIYPTIGIEGAPRFDFNTNIPGRGRLRTFINSGFAFSGSNAFSLDAASYATTNVASQLTGTYNLENYDAATEDIRLDFQFMHHGQHSTPDNKVWIRGNDDPATPWIEVYDLLQNQAQAGEYKLSPSLEISDLLHLNGQAFSPSTQVKWGQNGSFMATTLTAGNGYSFDEIRVYKVTDDIQLLAITDPGGAACGLNGNTAVTVSVRNSANHVISNIPVKIKLNNGSVISETISAINGNETISYSFTSPVNMSAYGNHFIEAWVDLATDNYRDNDTARATLTNSPVINTFPHLENFETSNGDWYATGTNSSWEYGTPTSAKINSAASGSKAWKTRLSGHYNDQELSYLYSPCFDISGLTNPTLSFSVALDLEDCGITMCDVVQVQYSTDGINWLKLGSNGNGTNWYNKNYAGIEVWSIQNYTRWHVATSALPAGNHTLRFRFVLQTDAGVNREGIAIDDIHIYDNTMGIYDGITMSNPVSGNVDGNEWIHFNENNQLVASMHPQGQNLGLTQSQTFIHDGDVRSKSGQYYHNRNIIVQPTNTTPGNPVKVRYYFTDAEMEDMLNANTCETCTKPLNAYELGVSKFSAVDKQSENGTLADNVDGNWQFILPENVAIVPFDKGYYAEFSVTEFSEFWLHDGGPHKNAPLPLKLLDFTAQKLSNQDVSLNWSTAYEINLEKFEIEVARGNEALQLNNFEKIATVNATGNSSLPTQYEFIDTETGKMNTRYYRLKMIDADGRYTYSPIRSVVFLHTVNWRLSPNPSDGIFNLVFQAGDGEKVQVRLFDALGRQLQKWEPVANGFEQKFVVDLSASVYASGVYLLQVNSGEQQQVFRMFKK